MTRKYRRILFYTAIVAFAAIGFVLIMYAQGYRWDPAKKRLVLSGAVYVKPLSPDGTDIFVNNKSADTQSAALIKNLIPNRVYEVKVAKDGYQTWQKELVMDPGFVAQAENVVLFPNDLANTVIAKDKSATDFSISPDQKILITNSNNKQLTARWLNESATTTTLVFNDKKRTLTVGFLQNGRSWSAGSQKFLIWRQITLSQKNWYIWNSADKSLTDLTQLYERKIVLKTASNSPLATKFNADQIEWLGNDNDLGVIIGGKLLRLDLQNESVTDLNLSDIVGFDFKNSRIAAIKSPGILILMDSAVQNVSALGQIEANATNVIFSPDGEKILYAGPQILGVWWLQDATTQPLKKTNDHETIYTAEKNISDAYWHYSNEYLMFVENQTLKTIELDGRNQHNIASWPDTVITFNYLWENKKLYYLTPGEIKSATIDF